MGDYFTSDFENTGFHWARKALSYGSVEKLRHLTDLKKGPGKRLKDARAIDLELSKSDIFQATLNSILPNARPVRHIAFKKSDTISWTLPWHQDRVISVKEKISINGFSNWSQKSGIWHCEPPTALLENMVFVQILLDDISAENGPMEIAVESHKFGRVTSNAVDLKITKSNRELVTGKAGDIIFVKALTLHRSQRHSVPSSRRTLRVDFFSGKLPLPLAFSNALP